MATSTPLNDNRDDVTYYNPSKSSTSMEVSNDIWVMTYGDGSTTSGELYTNVVTVAGVTFARQAVEVAGFIWRIRILRAIWD